VSCSDSPSALVDCHFYCMHSLYLDASHTSLLLNTTNVFVFVSYDVILGATGVTCTVKPGEFLLTMFDSSEITVN